MTQSDGVKKEGWEVMKQGWGICGILLAASLSGPVAANGVGENGAWQFPTSADKVNQAAIADMIEKKKTGYYSPPVYNTHIDHQYNCNVSSTATANEGSNTNLANSPTTSGASASSTGNSNSSDVGGWTGDQQSNSDQSNSGHVGASVDGNSSSHVSGSPDQALNSQQSNTGNQSASVDGSSACQFANVLN
jgi:hypothetical protein